MKKSTNKTEKEMASVVQFDGNEVEDRENTRS